jgi:hypothetical protein
MNNFWPLLGDEVEVMNGYITISIIIVIIPTFGG